MRKLIATMLLGASLGFGAQASPVGEFIDFEQGPFGAQPQGFVPNVPSGFPAGLVTISTNNGGASLLFVGNFDPQSAGNGLLVGDDGDGDFLVLNFSTPMGLIILSFGNDDPNFTVLGDLAVLTVFNGGTQVAQVTVPLNRNDLLDQTITFSGGPFDRATFAYTNAAGAPFTGPGGFGIGLAEIVDNITYFTFEPVPAPGALALFGAGMFGLGLARRRRG
jgi:hypothetical protein